MNAVPPPPPPPPPPSAATVDDRFIRLTPTEWRAAAVARLKELGFSSYGEIAEEAKEDQFRSTAARKLWMLIRGTL